MIKIVDYIKGLVKKAGLNPEDEKFKTFFENPLLVAAAPVEVPDELQAGIDSNLISLTVAKDNYGPLKNHYTALALNGIDTNIDTLLDELGFDDDSKTELKLEKSTGKRVTLLAKKIQALEAKKANADKPDKKAYQDNIDKLQGELRIEKEKAQQTIADFAKKEKDLRLSYAMAEIFANHKTTLDKLSPQVRKTTLQSLVNDALRSKEAYPDFDEHGNLTLIKKDGSKYYGENNTAVSPAQFIEQLFAKEKLLEVSNPQPPVPPAPPRNPLPENGKPPVGQNPLYQELMDNALKDFNNINGVKVQ